MTTRLQLRSKLLRPLLLAAAAALTGFAAPAWATRDFTAVAPTCVPDSRDTIEFGLTSATGGYLRQGRNPPLAYFCPVHNPDDLAATPTWTRLQLQYLDTSSTGGFVKARLFSKHRVTGAVKLVAAVSSASAPAINVVSAPLRRSLDFSTFGYYIVLDLQTAVLPTEAHMVMVTN